MDCRWRTELRSDCRDEVEVKVSSAGSERPVREPLRVYE
jgi:hypothetical protein